MKSKTLPAWARLVCTAAAALVFLLVYEWAVYGVSLGKIYLPASAWSDEVYYAKQLSAVVTHGVPQGYFGFNESHAEIGRFAAWGPAAFYLYAIPGLIFRGQNAFLYCNLFWVLAGWLCFVWGTRLDWKRQLLFGVGIAALNAPVRYVFSAMQEPLHYALVLAVLGLAAGIRRGCRHAGAVWAALFALCAVATLVRPYNAVLWLFPLVLAWPCCKAVGGTVVGAAASAAGTLVLMKKFYAPYLFANVDLGAVEELLHGHFWAAVRSVYYKLLGAWQQLGQEIADGTRVGSCYLLLFALLLVTLACVIWNAAHKQPVFWKVCALVVTLVVFLALMLMYRPGEASRHTIVYDLLLLAALVAEQPPLTAAATPVLLAVLSVAGIRMTTARGDSDTSTFTMPVYNAGLSQEVADLQTALTESQARLTSDDPWDHVCAYALGGGSHFGMLYAVPDGMGLQFDEDTYLLDPANEIHSRYVMASTDSDVAQYLEENGWALLYEGTSAAVYECG